MMTVVKLVLFLSWLFLFCSSSATFGSQDPLDGILSLVENVKDYDIVFPLVVDEDGGILATSRRTKRHIHEDTSKLRLVLPAAGALMLLELEPNDDVVVPGAQVEWFSGDGARKYDPIEEHCLLIGRVKYTHDSLVALSRCDGGFTGLIQLQNESFFIQPIHGLPDGPVQPHLVLQAPMFTRFSLADDEGSPAQNRHHRTASSANLNTTEESSPVEVMSSLLTVDRPRLVSTNAPKAGNSPGDNDTISMSRKITKRSAGALADEDATEDRASQHDRPTDATAQNQTNTNASNGEDMQESGYSLDSLWEERPAPRRTISVGDSESKWLEIAVAVDFSVVEFHGKSRVLHYILVLMNIVSAIYKDPSLDSKLKIAILRLLVYDNRKDSKIRVGNSKRSLENVNRWNEELLTSLPPSQRHDLAVWLTRLDLGGPSGYAPVSGTCDEARSCALNRDEGLTSAFIIAHEVGHVLGMSHDGDEKAGNSCAEEAKQGSVMAPMVAATFNSFHWSSCSKEEFHSNSRRWGCLKNSPSATTVTHLTSRLHATFTMDEQCRMEFGEGYSMCRSFDIHNPCSHLWCGHASNPQICKTKKGPPLEGTECGVDKWCLNGFCEAVDRRRFTFDPVVHNPRDGGWSQWSEWGPCSRSCGAGVSFRTRNCNNPRPENGGRECKGRSEEFQLCGLKHCEETKDFRAQQCSRLATLIELEKEQAALTWLPHEPKGDSLKCQLICKSRETGEVLLTGENVIDGTRCSYDVPNDICIQGHCQPLGCDLGLESEVKEDWCGNCEGNGTFCSNVTNRYRRVIQRSLTRVTVLPRGARHIHVECRRSAPVTLKLKNRRHHLYSLAADPESGDEATSVVVEGALFHHVGNSDTDTLTSQGPLLNEVVLLVHSLKRTNVVSVDVSYTVSTAEGKELRYRWEMDDWGPCSKSCGGGRRQRTPVCKDVETGKLVSRRYCHLNDKPQSSSENCNEISCDYRWVEDAWEYCSATCGSRGYQVRQIFCVHSSAINPNGTWNDFVNPSLCTDPKLPEVRPCNREPCHSHWITGNWSQCSVSCGTGTQTQDIKCPVPRAEPLFTCGPSPVETRACHQQPCPISCWNDASKFCQLSVLRRYCKIPEFRKLCCTTCSNQLPEE